MIANQPKRTRKGGPKTITVLRDGKVTAVANDADTFIEVTGETNPATGAEYPASTILQAYRKIIKARELTDSVAIDTVGELIFVAHPDVFKVTEVVAETTDEDETDEDETDETDEV
jgi:hypothetical protein